MSLTRIRNTSVKNQFVTIVKEQTLLTIASKTLILDVAELLNPRSCKLHKKKLCV